MASIYYADGQNTQHPGLSPPAPAFRKATPYPSSSAHGTFVERWRPNDVELAPAPPDTIRRPTLPGSRRPQTSSTMAPSVTVNDEANEIRDEPREIHSPTSTSRAGSITITEPASTRQLLSRDTSHRSLGDLWDQSPPGTPPRDGIASRSSWVLPQGRSDSPYAQSWMPQAGTSPYASGLFSSGYNTPAALRSTEVIRPLFPDSTSQIFEKDWMKEGLIVKLHDRDDVEHMANWKRIIFFVAPFLALGTLATYWTYFTLRILFVLSAQRAANRAFPLAWVFIAVEISIAIPIFMQSFWTIFILKKRTRPKYRLIGNDVPTIDVFITCCGEDVDLVLDTVRATCDVDYPLDKFRIVVLDDAKDAELQKAVNALASERHPHLHYRARTKIPGVPHHFKAGNLNYGFDEVKNMPGGASQYAAALDADMIPEQAWLRALIPHMLIDPKCALACPPQLFYNVPPSDPLCQSLDFFVHVAEPIKDALGVAWCTGSGYVLRRDALEEIGMFPKGSLAEDVATSTLMLGKGWTTAYVHEPLQFGTVPDSYGSHLKQRTRWAIGTVDTSFKLKFCLFGEAVKQMTFYQRLSSFIYAFLSLFNIFLMLSLFAMPIVLISGNRLVAYASDDQLRWLIRACFTAYFMNRLCEFVLFLPAGYACGQRGSRAQLWMSPYIAITIIRSFVLPKWLGGQTQAFKPSGSLKSELNERFPARRANLFRRFITIVFNYMAGYHILYAYFCLTAVTLTSIRCIVDQYTLRQQLVCLLTHAFWPPLSWVMVVSSFWIPITYAINPPSMPEREELLIRDPKTGIAHPTEESKKTAFKPQTALFELEYCITTAFTALVFVGAFFY